MTIDSATAYSSLSQLFRTFIYLSVPYTSGAFFDYEILVVDQDPLLLFAYLCEINKTALYIIIIKVAAKQVLQGIYVRSQESSSCLSDGLDAVPTYFPILGITSLHYCTMGNDIH